MGVPSAPTNVIDAGVSSTQINVFWNQNAANESVTKYNLRVNGTTVIPDIAYLSYAVKDLTPDTTYTFEVQAVNSLGVSAWSVPVSADDTAFIGDTRRSGKRQSADGFADADQCLLERFGDSERDEL